MLEMLGFEHCTDHRYLAVVAAAVGHESLRRDHDVRLRVRVAEAVQTFSRTVPLMAPAISAISPAHTSTMAGYRFKVAVSSGPLG